jgi:hypothetical protein
MTALGRLLISGSRAMPRYFFQQRAGGSILEGLEGSDLPDVEAAGAYAHSAIKEILAECIRYSRNDFPDSIVIVDHEQNEIGKVLLEQCLPARLRLRMRAE